MSMVRDLRQAGIALAVTLFLILLWSALPCFGILFTTALLAVAAFIACRFQGWLALFVIPMSSGILVFGFGDNNAGEQTALCSDKSMLLILGSIVISVAGITGAVRWYRNKT